MVDSPVTAAAGKITACMDDKEEVMNPSIETAEIESIDNDSGFW